MGFTDKVDELDGKQTGYMQPHQANIQNTQSVRNEKLKNLIRLYLAEGKTDIQIFNALSLDYPELQYETITELKAELFAEGKIMVQPKNDDILPLDDITQSPQQRLSNNTFDERTIQTYDAIREMRGKKEADKWLDRYLGIGEESGDNMGKVFEKLLMRKAINQLMGGEQNQGIDERRRLMGITPYNHQPMVTGNLGLDTFNTTLPFLDKHLTLIEDKFDRAMGLGGGGGGLSREDKAKLEYLEQLEKTHKQCPRCNQLNPKTANVCVNCGSKFILSQAQHQADIMKIKQDMQEQYEMQLHQIKREYDREFEQIKDDLSRYSPSQDNYREQMRSEIKKKVNNPEPRPPQRPEPQQSPQEEDVMYNYQKKDKRSQIPPEYQKEIDTLLELTDRLINRYRDGGNAIKFLQGVFGMGTDDEKRVWLYLTQKATTLRDYALQLFRNLRGYDDNIPNVISALETQDFVDWLMEGTTLLKKYITNDFLPDRNSATSSRHFIWNDHEQQKIKDYMDELLKISGA